jgi:hypothetical protein
MSPMFDHIPTNQLKLWRVKCPLLTIHDENMVFTRTSYPQPRDLLHPMYGAFLLDGTRVGMYGACIALFVERPDDIEKLP